MIIRKVSSDITTGCACCEKDDVKTAVVVELKGGETINGADFNFKLCGDCLEIETKLLGDFEVAMGKERMVNISLLLQDALLHLNHLSTPTNDIIEAAVGFIKAAMKDLKDLTPKIFITPKLAHANITDVTIPSEGNNAGSIKLMLEGALINLDIHLKSPPNAGIDGYSDVARNLLCKAIGELESGNIEELITPTHICVRSHGARVHRGVAVERIFDDGENTFYHFDGEKGFNCAILSTSNFREQFILLCDADKLADKIKNVTEEING